MKSCTRCRLGRGLALRELLLCQVIIQANNGFVFGENFTCWLYASFITLWKRNRRGLIHYQLRTGLNPETAVASQTWDIKPQNLIYLFLVSLLLAHLLGCLKLDEFVVKWAINDGARFIFVFCVLTFIATSWTHVKNWILFIPLKWQRLSLTLSSCHGYYSSDVNALRNCVLFQFWNIWCTVHSSLSLVSLSRLSLV